jgi:hypothetical protein
MICVIHGFTPRMSAEGFLFSEDVVVTMRMREYCLASNTQTIPSDLQKMLFGSCQNNLTCASPSGGENPLTLF